MDDADAQFLERPIFFAAQLRTSGIYRHVDLDRSGPPAFVILLTNRVYPTRDNDKIAAVRPAVHDAVIESLALCQREVIFVHRLAGHLCRGLA